MDETGNQEIAITFACGNENLFGILNLPDSSDRRGVVILVGGPQYRVGSHRQFILLARALAQQGVPVMRFDYRGMGDSSGQQRAFDTIDDDIRSAIDVFFHHRPNLQEVAIWGLCDAASAAAFYGYSDQRIGGLVLLNPWVFTEQGSATVFIKVYYLKRLLSTDVWRKIVNLEFNYRDAISSFFSNLKSTIGPIFNLTRNIHSVLRRLKRITEHSQPSTTRNINDHSAIEKTEINLPLPERMLLGLQRFKHPILFILSGNDLTTDEFREVSKTNKGWCELLDRQNITIHELKEADHTFSTRKWRDQVASWTLEWIKR